jgi:hypothetical protein
VSPQLHQYNFASTKIRLRPVRNVYLLINYGDFVDGSTSTTANPYAQLLSTTDPASAHADFLRVRENQTSATASSDHAAITATASPSSTTAPKGAKNAFLKQKIPIIIVLSVGVGLVLLGVFVLLCSRNRLFRRGRDSLASTYRSYQHIGAPAPSGGDMHSVRGYYQYGAPQQAYPNASWGRR